ncbi:DUF4232 domain-containing protein [Microlunatus elymi]|uniref:DUF4232 domain-containing protein n=1 Tax=Microlunatus elymi TaxID=2596828 RepID=UPI00143CFA9C|nr:DUF4232 domain-containing protein [Microlunatus elymi]
MSRRLLILLVAALVVVAAVLIVWRPWDGCDAPDELCNAVDEVEKSSDVVAAAVSYDVTRADPKDGDGAIAGWTVRLADDLTPYRAGAAAQRADAIIRRQHVPGVELHHFIDLVAGEPEQRTGKVLIYPVDVNPGSDPADRTTRAFDLWQHGATRVSTGAAEAADLDGLSALAAYAAARGYPTSLATTDGSVRYETTAPVAVEQVQLVLDTARLSDVATVVRYNTGQLSVHTTSPDGSTGTEAIKRWIEQRRPPGGDPIPYTLTSPGYADVQEGWVGNVRPPAPKPHPVPLPAGVRPWPKGASAPTCTGTDLKITLSGPDAASGRRFLALFARNVSDRPCAVKGVPTVRFFQADGAQQTDVTTVDSTPGVVATRVVVPPGEELIATLEWGATSIIDDADATASLRVTAVPHSRPTRLVPRDDRGPTTLDLADGARVQISPWAQAAEGWTKR